MRIKNKIETLGKLIVIQPFNKKIAGNEEDYIRTEGLRKLGYRVLQRKLTLYITGQSKTLHNQVSPEWKKGLWIYERTAQIGDSLMDLATRSLWKEAGISLDLFTTPHLGQLYRNDPWFSSIYTSVEQLPAGYQPDFIIVQSVHHRALRRKIKEFRKLPWICIQGYYDVPDFSRSTFGVRRTEYLIGINLTPEKFEWHARQKTAITQPGLLPENKQSRHITLVLGGVHADRTYHRWKELANFLIRDGIQKITVVGTGKIAELQAQELIESFDGICHIDNLINQLSLEEIQQCLHTTNTLISPDGGTMHMAVAAGTPHIISLFIKRIQPNWRLPAVYINQAISSTTDNTDNIDPSYIMDIFKRL